MKVGFVLDTTVFNHVLRDKIELASFSQGRQLFVAHIQFDELQSTPDNKTRQQLLRVFGLIPKKHMPTESAAWDISDWDDCKWGKEDGVFERMLSTLNSLNNSKKNNQRDILIAETALRNDLTLVTDDAKLATVMSKEGGKVVSLKAFLAGTLTC